MCDSPYCFEGTCTEQTDDGATGPRPLEPPSLELPSADAPAAAAAAAASSGPTRPPPPLQPRRGCLWDFKCITRPCGLVRCEKFWSLAFAIAHDPVAEEAMKYMLANDRVSMKTKSHEGTVWRQRRGVDDGNWVYAVLWCAVVWESGSDSTVKRLVQQRYSSLQPTHGLSGNAIELMGDCIENMLADARLTGPAIPKEIRAQRHILMKLVRDFDDNIFGLDRLLVVEGGPPMNRDRPCPWTFGVLTWLAHNGNLDQVAITVAHMAGSCQHVKLDSSRPA